MNKRIAEIRLKKNLTQREFGEMINLSSNFISLIETGKRNPSKRTIANICRIFHVSEEWLRYGIVTQHELDFDEALAEIKNTDDDFIKNIISVYMNLDDDSKKALRKVAEEMADKYNK